MSKQSIPWDKIKQEYFDSDIEEIRPFIKSWWRINGVLMAYPPERTLLRQTKGWRDQKQTYRAKITAKVQEKIINNPEVQTHTAYLLTAIKNINIKVAKLLGKEDTKFYLEDIPKIKAGVELLRLATGQSTSNIGGDKQNPIQVTNNDSNLDLSKLTTEEVKKYLELEKKARKDNE